MDVPQVLERILRGCMDAGAEESGLTKLDVEVAFIETLRTSFWHGEDFARISMSGRTRPRDPR